MATVITKVDPLTISKIFGDFYVVPHFQREYVWKKKQVTQLLSDIFLAWNSGAQETNYFIGSIVVFKDENGTYQVVDGQQRMATVYIAFAAIRQRLHEVAPKATFKVLDGLIADTYTTKEGDEAERHRVQLQYPQSNKVLIKIGKGEGDALQLAKTEPGRGLLDAYGYCRDFVKEHFGEHDEAGLKKFSAFLQLNCELIRVQSEDFSSALRIFEILNYRGVVLNAMDLLKNLMFQHTEHADHQELVKRWDAMLTVLRKAPESNLLRFLRYFLVSTYDFDKMPKATEVFDWIVTNRLRLKYESDPFGFVSKLEGGAQAYASFIQGLGPQGDASVPLQGISYQKTAVRQHLPILLSARHLRGETFDLVALWVEALVFAYAVAGAQWNEIEQAAPKWCKQLRRARNREDVQAFVDKELRVRISELAPLVREKLRQTSEIGTGLLKYILASLTNAVETSCGKDDDLHRFFKKRVTIEHVLPQNPSAEARASFAPRAKADDYIYRLGNLALLYVGPNAMGRNLAFAKKKKIFKRSDYELTRGLVEPIGLGGKSNKFRQTEEKYGLKPFTKWGARMVEDREKMLLAIAADRWGI